MGNVELDLLEHADRHERAQAIDERTEARARQPRRHAHHVLLGDPCIDVLVGALLAERVEQRVAVVARQQENLGVLDREANQRIGKSVSHLDAPAESMAAFASANVFASRRV